MEPQPLSSRSGNTLKPSARGKKSKKKVDDEISITSRCDRFRPRGLRTLVDVYPCHRRRKRARMPASGAAPLPSVPPAAEVAPEEQEQSCAGSATASQAEPEEITQDLGDAASNERLRICEEREEVLRALEQGVRSKTYEQRSQNAD